MTTLAIALLLIGFGICIAGAIIFKNQLNGLTAVICGDILITSGCILFTYLAVSNEDLGKAMVYFLCTAYMVYLASRRYRDRARLKKELNKEDELIKEEE